MANELELGALVTVDGGTPGQVRGMRGDGSEYQVDTLNGFMRWYPYGEIATMASEQEETTSEEAMVGAVAADVSTGAAETVDAADQPQDGEATEPETTSEDGASGDDAGNLSSTDEVPVADAAEAVETETAE